ncbi:GDP-L-fucose synthase [subsurface metagenome]
MKPMQLLSLMPTNLYGPNDNFDLTGSHVLAALIRKFHLARLLSLNDLNGIRRDLSRRSKGSAYNSRPGQELVSELGSQGIFSDSVVLWGTGTPFREFLHVDDLAAACLSLMQAPDSLRIGEIVNVGAGKDITISDLAKLIRSIVGFEGQINFNASRPDGTPRKLLDISQILKLGWKPKVALKEGITATYRWYCRSC